MKKSKMKFSMFVLILGLVLAALPNLGFSAPRDTVWNVGDGSVDLKKDGTLIQAKPAEYTEDSTQSAVEESSTVINTASLQVLVSSGGVVTLTSTPSISTTTAAGIALATGKVMILTGTSDANAVILQDDDTLSDSQLELGATTRTIGANDVLVLLWTASASTTGRWKEISYSNLD